MKIVSVDRVIASFAKMYKFGICNRNNNQRHNVLVNRVSEANTVNINIPPLVKTYIQKQPLQVFRLFEAPMQPLLMKLIHWSNAQYRKEKHRDSFKC
jgi:hypothetical protein